MVAVVLNPLKCRHLTPAFSGAASRLTSTHENGAARPPLHAVVRRPSRPPHHARLTPSANPSPPRSLPCPRRFAPAALCQSPGRPPALPTASSRHPLIAFPCALLHPPSPACSPPT